VNVIAETATVYRGGGRRWFSVKAACRAEARARLKVDCECDYVDHEGYGREHLHCSRHDPDRYPKIVRRLTRLYIVAWRGLSENPSDPKEAAK
jgi:hypothetical protein